MLLSLEALVQPNDVLLACTLQNVVLLHDLLEAALILHERLVDGFECDKLAREPMNGEVDLAEGSFTNDLADLVVVNFGDQEVARDVLQDLIIDHFARCQWTIWIRLPCSYLLHGLLLGHLLLENRRLLVRVVRSTRHRDLGAGTCSPLLQIRLHEAILGKELLLVRGTAVDLISGETLIRAQTQARHQVLLDGWIIVTISTHLPALDLLEELRAGLRLNGTHAINLLNGWLARVLPLVTHSALDIRLLNMLLDQRLVTRVLDSLGAHDQLLRRL